MKDDGIDIEKSLIYSGCIDIHVVIEDPDTCFSKSLSGLMEHYGFAKCHMSHPQRRKHAKRVFNGAHNVGNDAVAIGQGRDPTVKTSGSHDAEGDLDDDWYDEPLQGMKMDMNMNLMAYDTEGTEIRLYKPVEEDRTIKHGFAWLRLADVAHIALGRHGVNWQPCCQAKHYINWIWRNFWNKFYLVGNSQDFWPKYGKSEIHNKRGVPALFPAFFEEVARTHTARRTITLPKSTSTRTIEPAAFPALPATGTAVVRTLSFNNLSQPFRLRLYARKES